MDIEKEIQEIEEEISETPKNKSTEKHLARLKSKLSKLKEKRDKQSNTGGYSGYAPEKQGDATAVFVGYPGVGKSSLLNKLTNAESEVGEYSFTTLEVVPGMMDLDGAKIQLLDVPGLITGAESGKGRGKEVLSVIRAADLVINVTDIYNVQKIPEIRNELYSSGIRMDESPPKVRLEERKRGGIEVRSTVDLDLQVSTIKEVLKNKGNHNCIINIREKIDLERLIDAVSTNRVYLPSITVVNKIDLVPQVKVQKISRNSKGAVMVSAKTGEGLEKLKKEMDNKLNLIRVYLKPPSGEPDFDEPLILKEGETVKDAAASVHQNLAENLESARVWGPSAKFDGQQVSLNHKLSDGDRLTLND